MNNLAPLSRGAYGTRYAAEVLSTERGNLPNEVCAYFESKAWANAVKPKRNKDIS